MSAVHLPGCRFHSAAARALANPAVALRTPNCGEHFSCCWPRCWGPRHWGAVSADESRQCRNARYRRQARQSAPPCSHVCWKAIAASLTQAAASGRLSDYGIPRSVCRAATRRLWSRFWRKQPGKRIGPLPWWCCLASTATGHCQPPACMSKPALRFPCRPAQNGQHGRQRDQLDGRQRPHFTNSSTVSVRPAPCRWPGSTMGFRAR